MTYNIILLWIQEQKMKRFVYGNRLWIFIDEKKNGFFKVLLSLELKQTFVVNKA